MDAQVVKPRDRDALERALKLANEHQHAHDILRDGETQIERMLKRRTWQEVAEFASYGCQMRSLALRPWQSPPCCVGTDETNPEHAPAVALLRRLFDAGLSRYEPNPIVALATVAS
jgi:hypothetical protein